MKSSMNTFGALFADVVKGFGYVSIPLKTLQEIYHRESLWQT
jgi:hypothetical protein